MRSSKLKARRQNKDKHGKIAPKKPKGGKSFFPLSLSLPQLSFASKPLQRRKALQTDPILSKRAKILLEHMAKRLSLVGMSSVTPLSSLTKPYTSSEDVGQGDDGDSSIHTQHQPSELLHSTGDDGSQYLQTNLDNASFLPHGSKLSLPILSVYQSTPSLAKKRHGMATTQLLSSSLRTSFANNIQRRHGLRTFSTERRNQDGKDDDEEEKRRRYNEPHLSFNESQRLIEEAKEEARRERKRSFFRLPKSERLEATRRQFESKMAQTIQFIKENVSKFRDRDLHKIAGPKNIEKPPNPIIALYTIGRWRLHNFRHTVAEEAKRIEAKVDSGDYSPLVDFTTTRKNYQIKHIEGIYSMVTPQDNVLNAIRILRRALILAQNRQVGPFADLFDPHNRLNTVGLNIEEFLKQLPAKTPNSRLDKDLRIYINMLIQFQNPPGVRLDPDLARLQRQACFIRMDLNYPDIVFTIDLFERIRHHITEVAYTHYITTPKAQVEANYSILENLIRFRFSKAMEQFNMLYFESKFRLETSKDHFDADKEAIGLRNELRKLDARAQQPTREDIEAEKKIREREAEIRRQQEEKIEFFTKYDNRPRFKVRHTRNAFLANVRRKYEQQITTEVGAMKKEAARKKQLRYERERGEILRKYGVHSHSERIIEAERYRGGSMVALRARALAEFLADTFFLYSNKIRRLTNSQRWDFKRKKVVLYEIYRNDHPIRDGKYPPANAKFAVTRRFYERVDPYRYYFTHHVLKSRLYDIRRVYLPYLYKLTGTTLASAKATHLSHKILDELLIRSKINRQYTRETRQFKWDAFRDSKDRIGAKLKSSALKVTAPIVVRLGDKIKPLKPLADSITPPTPLLTEAALERLKEQEKQKEKGKDELSTLSAPTSSQLDDIRQQLHEPSDHTPTDPHHVDLSSHTTTPPRLPPRDSTPSALSTPIAPLDEPYKQQLSKRREKQQHQQQQQQQDQEQDQEPHLRDSIDQHTLDPHSSLKPIPEEEPLYSQVKSSLIDQEVLTKQPPVLFPARPPTVAMRVKALLFNSNYISRALRALARVPFILTAPVVNRVKPKYIQLKQSQTVNDYLMVLEPILNSPNFPKALWRNRRLVYSVLKHATSKAPGGKYVVKGVERINALPPIVFATWATKRITKGVLRATSRAFTFQEKMLSRNYTPTMRKQYIDSSNKSTRAQEQAIRAYLLLKAYGILAIRLAKVTVTLPVALAYVQLTKKTSPHRYSERAQSYVHAAKQELSRGQIQRALKTTLDMITNKFNTAKSRAIFANRHRVRLARDGFDPILHNHFVPPHIRIISALYMLTRGSVGPAKDLLSTSFLLLFIILLISAILEYCQRKFGGDKVGRLIGQSTEIFLNAAVWHILFSHGLATVSKHGSSEYDKYRDDGEMIRSLHIIMNTAWYTREDNQLKLLDMGVNLPDRRHHHTYFDTLMGEAKRRFYGSVFGSPIDHFEDRVLEPMISFYHTVFTGKATGLFWDEESLIRSMTHFRTPDEIRELHRNRFSFKRIRLLVHMLSNPSNYFNPAMLYSPFIDDPDDPQQVFEFYKEMQDPELSKLHLLDDEWWVSLPSWFTTAPYPAFSNRNYSINPGDLKNSLFYRFKQDQITEGLKDGTIPGDRKAADGVRLLTSDTDNDDDDGEDNDPFDDGDEIDTLTGPSYYEYSHILGVKPWLDNTPADELVPSRIENRVIQPGEDPPPLRYFQEYPDMSKPHEMFPYATKVLRDSGYLDPDNEDRKLTRSELVRMEGILREKAAQLAERQTDKDIFNNPYLDKADQVRSRIAILDFLEANDIKIIDGVPYIGVDPLASMDDERAKLLSYRNTDLENARTVYDDEEDIEITFDADEAGRTIQEFYEEFYDNLPEDELEEHLKGVKLNIDAKADLMTDFHDDRISYFSDGVGLAPPTNREDYFYDPKNDMYYDPVEKGHDDQKIDPRQNAIHHMTKNQRKTYVPMITHGYYADMFRIKLGMWLRDYHHGLERGKTYFSDTSKKDPAYEIFKWNTLPMRLMRNNGNYEYPRKWVNFRDAMRQLLLRDFPFNPVIDPGKVSMCIPHPDEWEDRPLQPNEFYKKDFINIIRQLDERFWGQKYIGDGDLLKIFFEFARSRVMNMVTVQDDQFLMLLDDVIYANYLDPVEYEVYFQDRFNEAFETLVHESPIFKESNMLDPGDVLEYPHSLPTERIKRLLNTAPEELTSFDIDDGKFLVALFDDYSKYLGEAIRDAYVMDQYHYGEGRYQFMSGIGMRFSPEEIDNQVKYLDLLAQHFPATLPSPAHLGQTYQQRPVDLQMIQSLIASKHYRKYGRPFPTVWWDPVITEKANIVRPADVGHYGDHTVPFDNRSQMKEFWENKIAEDGTELLLKDITDNPLQFSFDDYVRLIKHENAIPEDQELTPEQLQLVTQQFYTGTVETPLEEGDYDDLYVGAGPFNRYHQDMPWLNLDATSEMEYKNAYTPNWYERVGIDEDLILRRSYEYFYGEMKFNPLKQDRPPRWTTLDVNPAVIKEFMSLTYPSEEEFQINMRRKYSAKWHHAKKFFGFIEFRKYSRLLQEQWKKDVTSFKKVKKAYDELYWKGPGEDLDEALKLDNESRDWYFKDYLEGRFGDDFIKPYWSKERIKDFRRRIYLAESGKWEFQRFSERVYQDYHRRMKELQDELDNQVYYLLPPEEKDILRIVERSITEHEPPQLEYHSLLPEARQSLRSQIQFNNSLPERMEMQRYVALSKGHEYYINRYGEDIWYRRQLVRRWAKLFLRAYDRADLTPPAEELVQQCLIDGDTSRLPPLPVTQYVADRDADGQPIIPEFDKPFFQEWAILDLPRTAEQHEKIDKELVEKLWDRIIQLADQEETGFKPELEKSDFEWKNRGIEMALILVKIQDNLKIIQDMEETFRDTTNEYHNYLQNPTEYENPEAASTYFTEVLKKIREEIDHKLIQNQSLEEQFELYRPENLAMYSYYLSQLEKPDLEKEFSFFDGKLQDEPALIKLYGTLSADQILNRHQNNRELIPVGSSQFQVTTPERLREQVAKYLKTGQKFYLVFKDIIPGVVSRIEPKFVRNAMGRWVVDIPTGLEFVEDELTATAPSVRVSEDLKYTLQSLRQTGAIMSINEYNRRTRQERNIRELDYQAMANPRIVAPQLRPNIFVEEHYDKSYEHEHMIHAMEFYDMHYFRTLCMLGLIQSGKKYMVPVPGRNWKKVKERLRRFFDQNYTLFAYMYFKNYSLSQVPGEILFYLEEYYRMHNFDRMMFRGKPLKYRPINSKYEDEHAEYLKRIMGTKLMAVRKSREEDREKLKDRMMDEIANFPDLVLNGSRPIYSTPIHDYELTGDVLPLGTNIDLSPKHRKMADTIEERHRRRMQPIARNVGMQELLDLRRFPMQTLEHPEEEEHRQRFYEDLGFKHKLQLPYRDPQDYSTRDYVSAALIDPNPSFF